MSCSVIIVTHNSGRFIPKAMAALASQTKPADSIIIVDNASEDPSYLLQYQNRPFIEVYLEKENRGFCGGNNFAMGKKGAALADYILFLNPDAFLPPEFIEQATLFMKQPANQKVAALTGILLGYDIESDQPNGRYDSTGIFRNWYGCWFDRDQGLDRKLQVYCQKESIPAICGAVMFCRKSALEEASLKKFEVFDQRFFMYKEDIDLSLRLRQANWDLVLLPTLKVYHCRGWKRDRKQVPRVLRLHAARNEVRLHLRHRSPYAITSMIKYLLVKFLDL